jgi:hypothetical protein
MFIMMVVYFNFYNYIIMVECMDIFFFNKRCFNQAIKLLTYHRDRLPACQSPKEANTIMYAQASQNSLMLMVHIAL